jgi:uncharacterized protein (TIGR02145 family)
MKKNLFLLIVFFYALSNFAQQEPIMKCYLQNGSTKQYNIADIDNIAISNKSDNTIMKIYYQDNQTAEFTSKSIDKIIFEMNKLNNMLLSVYVANTPNQYLLFEIDSICFTFNPILHITSLDPSSGKVGDLITITGSCFGSSQGTSIVSFNGTNAIDYTSWNDTEIKVKVPTGSTSGMLSATVNGTMSNEVEFTVLAPNQPQIIKILPSIASIGDLVTLTGSNFGSTQGSGFVTFNGINAIEYPSWSNTEIKVKVPVGTSTGKTSVTANGTKSNEMDFVIKPNIATLVPQAARIGDTVTISGSGFGNPSEINVISYNGKFSSDYISWNSSQIKAKVPLGATTGKLHVILGDLKTNEIDFIVIPYIASLNQISGKFNDTITITGTGFGNTRESGIVSFYLKDVIEYISWSDTEIIVVVPQLAETGKLSVTASGKKSNEIDFTILPFITEITLTSSITGETITIKGAGFGSQKYSSSYVSFNGNNVVDYISWSSTEIKVKVPEKAESGGLSVTANGTKSNEAQFTVIPDIKSISPVASRIGDLVTITGSGFGTTAGTSIVSFNDINVTEFISWNKNEIKVKTPQGAVAGKLSVTVNENKSNEVDFTIIAVITSINPTSAKIGDEITITGISFGSTQGTTIVSFNGVSATEFISWNDTEIIVKVPAGAETGKLSVIECGQKSNEVDFIIIPYISNIDPTTAMIGDTITITGTGFASKRGSSIVSFNGAEATKFPSWGSTEIKATIPNGATSGIVSITVNGQTNNEVDIVLTITYSEISIGTQVWMKINLDVPKYRNGDLIPQVTDPTEWANLTTGAWCYYDNNLTNGEVYGKLYNWYAVNDSRGLAPTGWHIPSDAEWTTLINYLGGDYIGGGKMKETGVNHWQPPNIGATNESGFSALPGGSRGSSDGIFQNRTRAFWWTSSQENTTSAWYRGLYPNENSVQRTSAIFRDGFSVRCVKD